jgi:hypothetical protein
VFSNDSIAGNNLHYPPVFHSEDKTIRDAFTIAIEVSLHNTTLALLIAGTLLQNQDMVKPALIYSMFSF